MAGRTREQNSAELEDWRVKGLPGERPKRRARRKPAAGTTQPARRKSRKAGSEWLPAKDRKGGRSSGGRNGRGNGRAAVKDLERRAKELERELRSERRRARAEIAKLRAQLRAGNSGGKRGAKPSPSGRLDANAASFEQLRELGFTASQSAKLIARRESAGGFKAKADLRRIAGLSKSARELIEKRLSVPR